ncbi:MAG: PH domain-containing protein [Patescibacteria group bacterium]
MDSSETHRLGTRAFLLFLSRRLMWPIVFAVVIAGLWTQKERVPLLYRDWTDYGLNILVLLWIGLAVFIFLRSFFEYRGYSFRFDEEFFNVTRGYFVKHEMGIVYHQIQYVTVKCGIFDRAIGVGHLIIMTSTGGGNSAPSEIVLPALDKRKAQLVRRELLRKANRNPDRAPASPKLQRGEATSRSRAVSSEDELEDSDDESDES